MATFTLDLNSVADYDLFLRIKSLPRYDFVGRTAYVPDEYVSLIRPDVAGPPSAASFDLPTCFFDYQRDITRLALRKRKFAVFAECGLGKSLILLEYNRHVAAQMPAGRKALIVSPLMVIPQTLDELRRFYGDSYRVEHVRPARLQRWLDGEGSPVGITNYEAICEGLRPGQLAALTLDESSLLKSHYGAWGRRLIDLGRGLGWKLCLTGTPAPNDRIEYANHAVFLDRFPTVNSFLAKFFVNRGQTGERWELKAHALRPFYRAMSDWCIFLTDPATYGWKDNVGVIPPIHVSIEEVPLTDAQRRLVSGMSGDLYGSPGGITSRTKLSQLAKGRAKGEDVETAKPAYIRDLVASWPDEQTIIWCQFNREQEMLEGVIPSVASLKGETPESERFRLIEWFKSGRLRHLMSKGKILGFGQNLQCATRQVFSGLQDSYETYWQCVKRSNRVGSTKPLRVHIPVTEIERAMVENVLRKAANVEADTREQEALFKETGCLTF